MKLIKALLGSITITAALLGKPTLVSAESFIGPTSSTNRFVIGTNETVLIDTLLADKSLGRYYVDAALVFSNITNSGCLSGVTVGMPPIQPTATKSIPFAIPGPAELILWDRCALHFTRLTNPSMQMIQWSLNTNTITASVPTGKTIQFFWRVDGGQSEPPVATLSSGTQSFDVSLSPGDLLQGPVTVSFVYAKQPPPVSLPTAYIPYWFVEDVFRNPNAILSLGAGVPNVLVQKTADLKNWQPVATFPATLGSNSFYRLQISH